MTSTLEIVVAGITGGVVILLLITGLLALFGALVDPGEPTS